jgi:hypothetical protein
LLVDEDLRLRFQAVRVLRSDRTEAIIESGLKAGDRVCVTPLDTVVDGMKVRLAPDAASERPPRESGGAGQ